jgi:hypothetical protein
MPEEFKRSAEVYINYGEAEIKKNRDFIEGFPAESLQYYR